MSDPIVCPRCGNAATGNFCATCGAGLGTTACAGCGGELGPGARFCHHCGHAVTGGAGWTPTARSQSGTPWIVALVLTVLAVSAVAWAAMNRDAAPAPSMANAGNAATTGTAPGGPAPDISNMSPRERFDRLHDRVIGAAERNDTNTVIQFWDMAAEAYNMLPEADRDADARYHMAALHLMVGRFPSALALADTILQASPDNLTAYYIRALAAEFEGDSTAAARARSAFRTHYTAEIDKPLPEYTHHRPLFDAFLASIGTR